MKKDYHSEREIITRLRRIEEIWPGFIKELKYVRSADEDYSCDDVPERWINKIYGLLDELKRLGHLSFSYAVISTNIGPGAVEGNTGKINLRLNTALIEALKQVGVNGDG